MKKGLKTGRFQVYATDKVEVVVYDTALGMAIPYNVPEAEDLKLALQTFLDRQTSNPPPDSL